ncbi:MAG: InlB B-repeat-containing protein [Lentisphaeria bacterium]
MLLLLLAVAGGGGVAVAGNWVAQGEYFVETDPGVGNGVPLAADDATFDTDIEDATQGSVDVSGLAAGWHRIGMRFRDNSGTWGGVRWQDVCVFDDTDNAGGAAVQPAEYFVDDDPGAGKASPLLLSAEQTWTDIQDVIPVTVNTGELVPGVHHVGVRFRNAAGVWGATRRFTFFVFEDSTPVVPTVADIAETEYFWGDPPMVGDGQPATLIPVTSLPGLADGQNLAVSTAAQEFGMRLLGIRFKGTDGQWGAARVWPVRIDQEETVVTFDAQGGTTPSPASKIVTSGSVYGTLATTTRMGYTFAGWWTGVNGTGIQVTASTTVTITANQTLYAKWTANSYTVTFDAQSGTTPSPTSKIVTSGSAYGTLATTTRTGYTFAGWWTGMDGTGIQVTASTAVTITANQALYAKWTVNGYTVTFDAQGGTTPSPASKSVTYGSAYGTLATTTRTGYIFAGWWAGTGGTGTQVTATTMVAITAAQTLYAKWTTVTTYTVTFDAQGGTTANPTSKSVTYASAYGTLATTARTGYTFGGWWTGAGGTGDRVTEGTIVSIAVDHTLYAKWGCFEVRTLADLQKVGSGTDGWTLRAAYVLMNDIDATATATWNNDAGFVPIGSWSAPFTGLFDGNGHIIRGLTINRPATDGVGLFGFIEDGALIRNLGLISGAVTGKADVGGLIGLSYGTVNNCYATGAVTASSTNASCVGGLIGMNDGTVSNCYATGAVTASTGIAAQVGGLIGVNDGTVSNCYATGTVSSDSGHCVGGLIGSNNGTVSNCYATGAVTVSSNAYYVDGLIGIQDYGIVILSYWDIETSGRSFHYRGVYVGEGKTTAQMKHQATFPYWDFATVWRIDEGVSYPYLGAIPTLTFDAAGGTVTPASKSVIFNTPYGTLPMPTRTDYVFAGWWTGDNGTGIQVTEATIVSTALNHPIHAKWTLNQTISFPALPAKTYGDADFAPGATASSGLAVTYTSSNSGVAAIVDGKIHIVGAGTTSITAAQTGDDSWNAASPVTQTLTVAQKTLTATTENKTRSFGAANPAFSIAYTGLASGDTAAVLDTPPMAACSATATSGVGTYPITAAVATIITHFPMWRGR